MTSPARPAHPSATVAVPQPARAPRPAPGELDGHALVDHIAATLRTRVLRGEIPTGARLRQETLAAEFGVSRTPVREALRTLQASGIVELAPRRGAIVRGPTARDVREAYEVRAELEGYAAELAAHRIQEQQLERLHQAEALFRRSFDSLLEGRRTGAGVPRVDIEGWTRANDLFHQAVLDAAGNARLGATLADLHVSIPRDLTSIVLSESSRLLQENVKEHSTILAAIEQHDPAEARHRMSAHVRHAGALVTLRFEQRGG